ncbi:MAG: hypothetical protein K8S54_20190 [Spirochaetia bacterium]|nr:hypothetical protein [Spirochaetia bacterium]
MERVFAMGRIAFYSFLGLALALPVYYAWNTPFALIDDYSDWQFQRVFLSLDAFQVWFTGNFAQFSGGRYRPYFDISQGISWIVLGPNPGIHHIVRILVRVCTGLFIASAYLQFCNSWRGSVPRASFEVSRFQGLAGLLLLFIFFPNNPEARLAPQELHSGFFISMLIWIAARALTRPQAFLSTVLLYYIAFFGLAIAKEVNFFVLPVCILVFHLFIIKRHRLVLSVLPILIFVHTLAKITTAYKSGGYGSRPVNAELIWNNVAWIIQNILLINLNWIVSIAFIALLLFVLVDSFIQIRKPLAPETRKSLLILLTATAFLGAFGVGITTSWLQVLRYWYPMIPPIVLILGIALFRLNLFTLDRGSLNRLLRIASVLVAIVFFLSAWPAVLYQYIVQHHSRNTELMLIKRLQTRLDSGETIQLDLNESEYADKLRTILLDFNPYYYGTKPYSLDVLSPDKASTSALFVTRNAASVIPTEEIESKNSYAIFKRSLAFARAFHLIRKPETYLDHGAEPFWAYKWYIGKIKR